MLYKIDKNGEVREVFSGKKVPKNEASIVKSLYSLEELFLSEIPEPCSRQEVVKDIAREFLRRMN